MGLYSEQEKLSDTGKSSLQTEVGWTSELVVPIFGKKKKSKQRSGWQLSDSGGSTRSSDEAFVMRVEQRG